MDVSFYHGMAFGYVKPEILTFSLCCAENDVAHGDIKLPNFMLNSCEELYTIDFGRSHIKVRRRICMHTL